MAEPGYKILKSFKRTLINLMLLIVNSSFSTEFFPANLKTANIIPILMKNDHTSSKNYCQILLYFEFIASCFEATILLPCRSYL